MPIDKFLQKWRAKLTWPSIIKSISIAILMLLFGLFIDWLIINWMLGCCEGGVCWRIFIRSAATANTTNSMEMVMIHDKDVDQYVARQMRALRTTMGVTQEVIAQELGVTFQQVQKYEKGTNRISAGHLFQFAAALDVSILALFPEQVDFKPYEPIPPATVRLLRMINRINPEHYGELYVVLKAMAKLSTGAEEE